MSEILWCILDIDGKTYPFNIEDGTVCICGHDENQECSCMCHKQWSHT